MKNETKKYLTLGAALFAAFLLLTFAVLKIDVAPIGPEGSSIGLSAINGAFAKLIGTRIIWYTITDWLGLAAIATAFGFALLGLWQWVFRKSLKKVDADIFILGGFYIAVILCYIFFEINIVNYRPVIIGSGLEASFPSSHTMIVFCIMGAAMLQFCSRIKNKTLLTVLNVLSAVLIAVTVVGRLISGVHWLTDIAAGLLLGSALLSFYSAAVSLTEK